MVFSSIEFLYMFLPIVLIVYFFSPKKIKNFVLLLASLIFYFFGETRFVMLLIFAFIFNYYSGLYIEKKEGKKKKILLILNLVINFGLLFYFKYFNFFLDNINHLFNSSLSWSKIIMPIGISFFTFQATSYVIDIYNGKIKSANNLFNFATYLSLFPQLIAGPIVRYETIEKELKTREHSFKLFSSGVKRFIIGLSKKVLISNVLGEFSESLSTMDMSTILGNWSIAVADTLQIYFDFSGYSDMAIGLGLMFGFKFLENFNYPLFSKSITDFWRRWHMSLSSWFKDYVYIPLGGSKKGAVKRYINIIIVWMLTGFWHGASWNFVLWGLYYSVILIIEKMFLLKILKRFKLIPHIYTTFLVTISFIIFNNDNLSELYIFIKDMFGFTDIQFTNINTNYYIRNYFIIVAISAIGATPLLKNMKSLIVKNGNLKKVFNVLEPVLYIILLLICTAFIVDESFNPFLYFRF